MSMETWNICIDDPFYHCERVYPLQQKKVKRLIEAVKDDRNVLRVFIFGSSVTSACQVFSDVDAYFVLRNDENPVKKGMDFACDFWTNYTADESLKREIKMKGVLVYERDTA